MGLFDSIGHALHKLTDFSGRLGTDFYHHPGQNLLTFGGHSIGEATQSSPGSRHDTLFGGAKAFQGEKAYNQEQEAQQAYQQNQNNLLNQNAAQFGQGASGDAISNAARIRAGQSKAQQAALSSGLQSADNQYSLGLTQNRIGQARSGTIGSGADAANRNDLLSTYYGNVGGANQQANQVGQNIASNLTNQQGQIANKILGGQVTDTTGMRYDAASLANPDAVGTATGNIITGLTNGYKSNKLSQAYQ